MKELTISTLSPDARNRIKRMMGGAESSIETTKKSIHRVSQLSI